MKRLAIVALLGVAVPAYGFQPEREEFEPLRIRDCFSSHVLVAHNHDCLIVSGEVEFVNSQTSNDNGFGTTATEVTVTGVSQLVSFRAAAEITFFDNQPYLSRYEPEHEQRAYGAAQLGNDHWTIRAGDIRETSLNFSGREPFGNTLGSYRWGHIMPHMPQTGLQASAEVAPGFELTAEYGDDGFWANSGASLTYTAGPVAAYVTAVHIDTPTETSFVTAHASIIEDTWSVLVIADHAYDVWRAMTSASVTVDAWTAAGFVGLDNGVYYEHDRYGLELTRHLGENSEVSLSAAFFDSVDDFQQSYALAVFHDFSGYIELYAMVGLNLYEARYAHSSETRYLEVGAKYSPTEEIEASLTLYADDFGFWQTIAQAKYEF